MAVKVITREELSALFDEEERTGIELLEWLCIKELDDGRTYAHYINRRTGLTLAVWEPRIVHFGLNSITDEKVQELVNIVEREGGANASWGCDGRTRHQMLARQLEKMLPQYRFDIGYNYKCFVAKEE